MPHITPKTLRLILINTSRLRLPLSLKTVLGPIRPSPKPQFGQVLICVMETKP